MTELLYACCQIMFVSLIAVALKAAQQLNVQHDRRWWVIPTSYSLSYVEVSIFLAVAKYETQWMAIPIGTGSWIGCLLAMELHQRLRNRQHTKGVARVERTVPLSRNHSQGVANPPRIQGDLCDEWR